MSYYRSGNEALNPIQSKRCGKVAQKAAYNPTSQGSEIVRSLSQKVKDVVHNSIILAEFCEWIQEKASCDNSPLMGRDGLEQNDVTTNIDKALYALLKQGGTFSGALSANSDLEIIVANWDKLSDTIKTGILAIINGHIGK